MYAEPFLFEEYAGSGRGLIAAPIFLDNLLALRADIDAISFKVIKLSDSSEVTGSVPLSAMKVAAVPWDRDDVGYSFLWNAPGTLWPDPNEKYRIIVIFTVTVALGGYSFIKTWEVSTKDPEAPT